MNWSGMKVLILGAARQGIALARYLAIHDAVVVLSDQRQALELVNAQEELNSYPITWSLGGHSLDLLAGIDLVCPSGGVPLTTPLVLEAIRLGIPLSNDSQIFMQTVPCRVVGITGSAGKTTTTTLTGRMALKHLYNHPSARVYIGGNVGNPLISDVDLMNPEDLAICEFSSFQLELMSLSPQIAAILNITPNHLDRHKTMENYVRAKENIINFQQNGNLSILNRDDPISWSMRDRIHGQLVSFGRNQPEVDFVGTYLRNDEIVFRSGSYDHFVIHWSEIQLRGAHNLMNCLAACALAGAAGISPEAMRMGIIGFTGVDHRLQLVRRSAGIDWYNDSIATAPERSIAAINSFDEPLVLLAGGRDKDLPWDQFVELVNQRVDHLILFGEAAEKIADLFENIPFQNHKRLESITECKNLHQAVLAASRIANSGDVVLLAPGGTSFDEFNDFEERGERYKKWVNEL